MRLNTDIVFCNVHTLLCTGDNFIYKQQMIYAYWLVKLFAFISKYIVLSYVHITCIAVT